MYEHMISAIREELVAERERSAAAAARADAAEQIIRENSHCTREGFEELEHEVKRMAQVGVEGGKS